jgi:hypothetical protein
MGPQRSGLALPLVSARNAAAEGIDSGVADTTATTPKTIERQKLPLEDEFNTLVAHLNNGRVPGRVRNALTAIWKA